MRKFHQVASGSMGLSLSFAISVCITGVIFAFIPFASTVAKPTRALELRKASLSDLPPPTEDEPPPLTAKEEEVPLETLVPPQLGDAPPPIGLSPTLEVAAGSGGVLAGFGDAGLPVVVEKTSQDAFAMADLDKRPEVISQVPPVYPPELRKAKVEGLVTVVFFLNEQGHVEDARIEKSTRPEFERPALEAIRKWRFRPGMREGKAVSTFGRIPMRFTVGPQ